mmetsp:Transcript_7419/g.22533  ORF Transcript_7419/g.22533 Transcript_7419/m.22533 type:complete len:259 (-) Transcript_7419:583-1359(-)
MPNCCIFRSLMRVLSTAFVAPKLQALLSIIRDVSAAQRATSAPSASAPRSPMWHDESPSARSDRAPFGSAAGAFASSSPIAQPGAIASQRATHPRSPRTFIERSSACSREPRAATASPSARAPSAERSFTLISSVSSAKFPCENASESDSAVLSRRPFSDSTSDRNRLLERSASTIGASCASPIWAFLRLRCARCGSGGSASRRPISGNRSRESDREACMVCAPSALPDKSKLASGGRCACGSAIRLSSMRPMSLPSK